MEKVLLLGDYSTIHKNLCEGIKRNGITAETATFGDGWKKINADINLGPTFLPGRIRNYLAAYDLILRKVIDYDRYNVIQLINPTFIPRKIFLSQLINNQLASSTAKVFLSACGNDYYYYKTVKDLDYNPLTSDQSATKFYTKERLKKQNDFVVDMVDGIIPSSYTYWKSYEHTEKVTPVIAYPFCLDRKVKIDYRSNRKLRLYHGVTRPIFKGSSFIKEALEKAKFSYPNDLDILVTNKLTIDEFKKALEWCDVYVDQTNSYGYGYAAIHALSKGKLVLSGFEPPAREHLKYVEGEEPVLNIRPEVPQIIDTIKHLLNTKKTLEKRYQQIQTYLEINHGCEAVAKKYIDIWQNKL